MIKRLQAEHKEWAEKNFPNAESWQSLVGIMEELGELSHAHLKDSQGIRITEDHVEKAKDSLGDIVIFMAGYCTLRGFDFDQIIRDTWKEVKNRDWKKHPESGV